jgi:hypothetical protein
VKIAIAKISFSFLKSIHNMKRSIEVFRHYDAFTDQIQTQIKCQRRKDEVCDKEETEALAIADDFLSDINCTFFHTGVCSVCSAVYLLRNQNPVPSPVELRMWKGEFSKQALFKRIKKPEDVCLISTTTPNEFLVLSVDGVVHKRLHMIRGDEICVNRTQKINLAFTHSFGVTCKYCT